MVLLGVGQVFLPRNLIIARGGALFLMYLLVQNRQNSHFVCEEMFWVVLFFATLYCARAGRGIESVLFHQRALLLFPAGVLFGLAET